MSKTVTIPSGDNPFICKINDVYYSYPAGAVVEVPDAVAALIQANAGKEFKPDGKQDIVIPRDGSAGQILSRTSDGAAWIDNPNPTPYTLSAATEEAIGGVKMTAYVEDVASDADASDVRSGLIALIEALKEAGIVSDTEPEEEESGT